jgi:hypothetical protein
MTTKRKASTKVRLPGGATVDTTDEGTVDLDREIVRDSKGRRITESRAEQIAAEALAKVHRGRPSLTGDAQHSPKVSVRLRPATVTALKKRAAREGKSPSQLARELLERELA